jgi:hypothetical protein
LKQEHLPQKIFINVCKEYKRFENQTYDSSQLDKYKDNELIQINYLDEDYGPATKTIGGLKNISFDENKIQYMYVCDDDKISRPDKLKIIYSEIQKDAGASYCSCIKICRVNRYDPKFGYLVAWGSTGWAFPVGKMNGFEDFYRYVVEKEPALFYVDDHVTSVYLQHNDIEMKDISHLHPLPSPHGSRNNWIDNPEGTQENAIRNQPITKNHSFAQLFVKEFPHINIYK